MNWNPSLKLQKLNQRGFKLSRTEQEKKEDGIETVSKKCFNEMLAVVKSFYKLNPKYRTQLPKLFFDYNFSNLASHRRYKDRPSDVIINPKKLVSFLETTGFMSENNLQVLLTIILGHELGHTLQSTFVPNFFAEGVKKFSDSRIDTEENADEISGLFTGHFLKQNGQDISEVESVGKQLYSLIPSVIHGTSEERSSSYETGLKRGYRDIFEGLNRSFEVFTGFNKNIEPII